MNNFNRILTAMLVVQVALVAFIYWPRATQSGAAEALLGEFELSEVSTLAISNNDGERVELSKSDGEWVIANADNYPADDSKVTPFIDKLKDIQSNRLVTQTDTSHGPLKVASSDFERLIEVGLQDGSTHNLYLGTSGGPSATHVRLNEQSEVYLTGALASWDANSAASGWIDTLYITLPPTATVGLNLQNANGALDFVKTGESWTMVGITEGEGFNESAFTSMLNQITRLNMQAPLGTTEEESYGMVPPHAMVTLQTNEGVRTLQLGAEDTENNGTVVKWSESPYYVRISAGIANNIVDKTREDFIQAPPEVAPEGQAPAP
jgi:hypothetical protein